MCILLKFDSANFGASNLLFSKVIEEKPLRCPLDPPLVKEGVKDLSVESPGFNSNKLVLVQQKIDEILLKYVRVLLHFIVNVF